MYSTTPRIILCVVCFHVPEEGGLGTADGKQKKTKKSKDSVQRAIKIAENANRNHAHMILDMRGQ